MKSMTGYGALTGKVGRGKLHVEVKTVNHRYCECALRIPPRMGALEARLREFLQTRFQRGKIDVFLKEVEPIFGGVELVLDVDLARLYQRSLKKLRKSLQLSASPDLLSITGIDPFIRTREREGNYLKLWRPIEALLQKAVAQVDRMRAREGAHLLKDQRRRLQAFGSFLASVSSLSEKNARERLTQRAENFSNGMGTVPLTADKMDISEELTRLSSHIAQYRELLGSREPSGRKLDFLIQEMHREINTVGAKAADAGIAKAIVEMKALLESLREQVQNIV